MIVSSGREFESPQLHKVKAAICGFFYFIWLMILQSTHHFGVNRGYTLF